MNQKVESFSWEGQHQEVLVLKLKDGTRYPIPKKSIETVNSASEEDAANLEVLGDGSYLHWPALDFDLYVPSLLAGISGSASWMSILGRHGGLARSERKANAARINGRKGGRPCRTAKDPADRKVSKPEISKRPPVILISKYSFSPDEYQRAFGKSLSSRPTSVPRFM